MIGSRGFFAVLGIASLLGNAAAEERDLAIGPDRADYVVVDKSDRKLYLYKAGRVLREFDVSLGLVPNGPKQREGDFRTPEGKYIARRAQRQQRLLLVDPCLLSQRVGPRARARPRRRSGRADHDPRLAQRAEIRPAPLSRHRLDGRLHRRQQLRHGRHLAHDARIDADRDSPVGRAEAVTTQWTR